MDNKTDSYQPGICNIGPDEVSKRKKELVASVVATLVLTGIIFYKEDSVFLWSSLFAIACFTALMHLQVMNRFCVFFGWFGQYNFGKLGKTEKIKDPGHIGRDRRKTLIIGLQTLAMAFLYTVFIYLLTRKFHF